jgi:hypothetical protein
MWRFIIEILVTLIVVVLLGCVFCIPAYSQNWQDEEHVWSEEKGRFEVHNRAHGRTVNSEPQIQSNITSRPFKGQPWEKYLSRNVKYGKRPANDWEIEEAQRKLWANGVIKQRAAVKGQQRRDLMAHRKATGWYAQRRAAGLAHGNSAANMHMQVVSTSMYRAYQHHGGCAPRRGPMYHVPKPPQPVYTNYKKPPVYNPPKYTYNNTYVENDSYPNRNR